MHEFSIVSYLVENVEQHAQRIGASKVVAINLVAGERSGIVDDSLRFYFDQLSTGTLAEGSRLNVRRTPMRFHCAPCGDDYHPADTSFRCPGCGVVGQVVDDGSELLIESLEVET